MARFAQALRNGVAIGLRSIVSLTGGGSGSGPGSEYGAFQYNHSRNTALFFFFGP